MQYANFPSQPTLTIFIFRRRIRNDHHQLRRREKSTEGEKEGRKDGREGGGEGEDHCPMRVKNKEIAMYGDENGGTGRIFYNNSCVGLKITALDNQNKINGKKKPT